MNAKRDPKEFWKLVKNCKLGSGCSQNITPDEWVEYFKGLLNQVADVDIDHETNVTSDLQDHDNNCNLCDRNLPDILNSPITEAEIRSCIKSLPNNKAPGVDGVLNELLKASVEQSTPYLALLFNQILKCGIYPLSWCKALLCPIFKNGSPKDVNNYRGISLLSVVSKCFTKLLNDRFVNWAQTNDKLSEAQAGFRKGYATVDHMFTLFVLAQKYLSKRKGRFYCLFVDFSKAFDSIPHNLLWNKLLNSGIHGNIIKTLRNMYTKLTSCVRSSDGLTNSFSCNVGTRQGCMLSPFMFIMYIDTLVKMLNDAECSGIFVNETLPNLLLLMYADDIALCADTVGRLQKQINVLEEFCLKWGMKVNMKKTKVLVFRRGGIVRQNEKWFFHKKKIENVSYYKYLGVIFSSKLCWTEAQKTLATQSQKAIHMMKKLEAKCNAIPIETAFELFDRMIVPILCYGSEVWGYQMYYNIENVHVKFCKNFLGLSSSANNCAALGECGRYPLCVIYFTRCIQFWFKLLQMESTRYPKACYSLARALDSSRELLILVYRNGTML